LSSVHAGAGPAAALRAMADRFEATMDAEITIAVDPAAGHHDELILVLARELLANAAKHSAASHVAVSVAVDAERIELDVRDDDSVTPRGRIERHDAAPGRRAAPQRVLVERSFGSRRRTRGSVADSRVRRF
jgi:signal transduction histidine kinase